MRAGMRVQFEGLDDSEQPMTTREAARLIADVRTIVAHVGRPFFPGERYENDLVRLETNTREVLVLLKRKDEAGHDETEVLNAYSDEGQTCWTVYTLRPGHWAGYVHRLAKAVRERNEELDAKAMQMVTRSFLPVDDSALKDASVEIVEREPSEHELLIEGLYQLSARIVRSLRG